MKLWGESQGKIRRVRPDKERAESILKMIDVRMKALELLDRKEFSSLVAEGYYEIVKEALTALMALDGYKTLSHEVLIGYLKEFFPEFTEHEVMLADRLRQVRNKIAYKGFFVAPEFIERNEKDIKELVVKLVNILRARLGK